MAVLVLSPDQVDQNQEAFDAYVDSLGPDGRLPRVHLLTEDLISRIVEIEDLLVAEGQAFRCVVHEDEPQPQLCPACALESCQRGAA
ncbi:MAG: hypothetical protein ACRENL_00820 [Candidatus Dormibacteria bacterium]